MTVETIITAAEFFAAKLSYETDPTDLAASRAAGAGPVVIDTRSSAGWAQGRIPGAIHIPGAELADRAPAVLPDRDAHIVIYCWGQAATAAREPRSPWHRLAPATYGNSSAASSTGLAKDSPSRQTRGGHAAPSMNWPHQCPLRPELPFTPGHARTPGTQVTVRPVPATIDQAFRPPHLVRTHGHPRSLPASKTSKTSRRTLRGDCCCGRPPAAKQPCTRSGQ
jgi:hypothetical protein